MNKLKKMMDARTSKFLIDESNKIMDKKVHYYVTSGWSWHADDDMEKAIKMARKYVAGMKRDMIFMIFLVPGVCNEASYRIKHFVPCVEDCHLIAMLDSNDFNS